MARKKIAVFSTSWNAEYFYAFLQGLSRGARERDADLYVFNTYGDSDQEYELFSRGEFSIFFLPELKEFDGILMASNNAGRRDWMESLMERIAQSGIPCVGVEQQLGLAHSIGADNYSAMREMVEHLVTQKHCRTLYYVGGPSGNEENRSRKQAFCDVLREHRLECPPERIRDYSFRWEDGYSAYGDFKALGLDKPDAVVCANDYMAIGYLVAADEDGLRAPEDFLITGFDNIREAQQYYPRISSVDRASEELGFRSVRYLDDIIRGLPTDAAEYSPSRPVFSQSTGDDEGSIPESDFRKAIFRRNKASHVTRLHLRHLRTSLLDNRSTGDFIEIICRFAPLLGLTRFSMALDAGKIVDESRKDRVFFGSFNGTPIRENGEPGCGLLPQGLIPDDDVPHTYLFSPCHSSGKNYGYFVTVDCTEVVRENLLSEWMLTVDNALENLRQSLHLQNMNKKLNALYRLDPMTGLYNRFALEEKGEQLLQANREQGKSTLIVFVDMDSLKRANDTFGHDVGDLALKTIADAVRQVCSECLDFAVRYGGDEFLLLGTYTDAAETDRIAKAVERTITALGSHRNLPFPLTATTGCTEIRPTDQGTLESYIRRADQQMYGKKRR